jgi:hypothetical protein
MLIACEQQQAYEVHLTMFIIKAGAAAKCPREPSMSHLSRINAWPLLRNKVHQEADVLLLSLHRPDPLLLLPLLPAPAACLQRGCVQAAGECHHAQRGQGCC